MSGWDRAAPIVALGVLGVFSWHAYLLGIANLEARDWIAGSGAVIVLLWTAFRPEDDCS